MAPEDQDPFDDLRALTKLQKVVIVVVLVGLFFVVDSIWNKVFADVVILQPVSTIDIPTFVQFEWRSGDGSFCYENSLTVQDTFGNEYFNEAFQPSGNSTRLVTGLPQDGRVLLAQVECNPANRELLILTTLDTTLGGGATGGTTTGGGGVDGGTGTGTGGDDITVDTLEIERLIAQSNESVIEVSAHLDWISKIAFGFGVFGCLVFGWRIGHSLA